jgi:hypothetical protein
MLKQRKIQDSFEWRRFPPYLCYGIIDDSSKRIIDDFHVVDYLMNNEKVLELRISQDCVEIEDYWRGKYLGMSHYPKIEQAVLSHYSYINQLESPIHQHWVHDLSKRGNIYVEYIDIKKIYSITFPEVFLIDMFIPMQLEDESLIDKLISVDSLMYFDYDILDSVLTWKNREDNRVIQENISLIKIKVPIAFVSEVFDEIKEYVHKEKMWRVFIQLDNPNRESAIKIFYGSETDIYFNYSIIIK